MTSAEVAHRLGVDTRTVHRMVARGTLTAARTLPNRTMLFDAQVIEFFARTFTPRPYRRRCSSPPAAVVPAQVAPQEKELMAS